MPASLSAVTYHLLSSSHPVGLGLGAGVSQIVGAGKRKEFMVLTGKFLETKDAKQALDSPV